MTDEQLAKIEGQANDLLLWADSDANEDPHGYALAFLAFCAVVHEDSVLEMIATLRRYKEALESIEKQREVGTTHLCDEAKEALESV